MGKYNWQQHSKKKKKKIDFGDSLYAHASPDAIIEYIRESLNRFVGEPINFDTYNQINSQVQRMWPGAEVEIDNESGRASVNITKRIQPIHVMGQYYPVDMLQRR
jgi:hypothetical protein